MHLFRLAYKNIIHRKARFILTILSVVVGVMFVAGTFTFTDGIKGIFGEVSVEVAGQSSAIVRSKLEFGDRDQAFTIPRELKGVIQSLPSVLRVEEIVGEQDLAIKKLSGEIVDPALHGPPTFGANWDSANLSNLVLIEKYGDGSGRPPAARGEFAIDVTSAEQNNLILGETYVISIPSGQLAGPHDMTLVGTFRLGQVIEGNIDFNPLVIALDTDSAVDFFNDGMGLDQFDVYLEPGVTPAQAVRDIESILMTSPDAVDIINQAGIQIEVIQTQEFVKEVAASFDEFINIFRNVLLGFAAVILLVSAFVIFNTFSIILDQRIKELGLLRAVGLSGGQLLKLVLGEALIVGVAATILGFAASIGVFYILVAAMEGLSGGHFPAIALTFEPRTIIAAIVVGVGLTMISALPAALRARRVPPIAALREGVSATRQTEVVREPAVGITFLAIGIVFAILSLLFSWLLVVLFSLLAMIALYWGGTKIAKWAGHFTVLGLGIVWMILATRFINLGFVDLKTGEALTLFGMGAVFVFLGVNLVSPLFGMSLARGLGAPIRMFSKVIGKLGVSNASRNPKRTATTAAALMIGIALLSTVSIFTASIKSTLTEVLEGTIKSDLILCKSTCGPESDTFSLTVAKDVRTSQYVRSAAAFSAQGEGFKVISTTTNSEVTARDTIFAITGTDLTIIDEHLDLGTENGNADTSKRNGVYVYTKRAKEYGLEIGSTVAVQFPSGAQTDLEVVGIYQEAVSLIEGEWAVQGSLLDEFIVGRKDYTVSILLVAGHGIDLNNANDPKLGEVRFDIFLNTGAILTEPNLVLSTKSEQNEELANELNQILDVISILLGLSFVVAILGIANTLALSIFERIREIGLLRAVGMKRGQVRRMIVVEGFIIGIFGSLVGVIMGVTFGVVGVKVVPDEFIAILSFSWGRLLIYAGIGAVAGLLSTLFPAIKAGRTKILQAISQQ